MKRLVRGLLLTILVLATGCEPALVTPGDPDAASGPAETAAKDGDFTRFQYQVRPGDGSGSTAFGEIQAWVGFPPNPIYPPNPIAPALVLRGVLHNTGGERLQHADVTLEGQVETRVTFNLPPNPCATTFLWAAVSLASPLWPDPGPPNIMLATDAGALVAFPNPGPPTILDTEIGPPIVIPDEPPPPAFPNPGPPNTPGACLVTGSLQGG